MVGTSGDVNTSVHEGPSVEAEIVTSPDSAPGLNPEIPASQDDAGQGDTPISPDDASDNPFGGADDSSDDDDEWNPEDDGAFGGEGADEPDFGDDDFDDDDDFTNPVDDKNRTLFSLFEYVIVSCSLTISVVLTTSFLVEPSQILCPYPSMVFRTSGPPKKTT